jgi:two-component system sensor histidine kinase/response regulator
VTGDDENQMQADTASVATDAELGTAHTPTRTNHRPAAIAGRPSILIVDDERSNRVLLRACLEATYEVTEATDGAAALDRIERGGIDLVLLDVMMPGINGLELCERMKQRQTEYLPVILLTALGRQDDRNAGLQAGADDFLTKPFDRHELRLRARTFVRLRQQEQRIRDQLRAMSAQEQLIRRQVEELRELGAMKDELVSLLVHDVRNPLTGIAGFLGALAQERLDPGLKEETEFALEASARIGGLLDDLLQIKMLESGALTLRRELVSMARLIREAVASLRGEAFARNVEIAAETASDDPMLHVDAKLLRRAIENLVSNALKYAPSRSVVRVLVRRTDSEVQVEVGDRGAGIPADFKPEIFRRFASVEAARGEARRGVGLGLYLVSLVAVAHGGHAKVRDRARGGAAFSICLPSARAVEEA